jgi:hypothetical protein
MSNHERFKMCAIAIRMVEPRWNQFPYGIVIEDESDRVMIECFFSSVLEELNKTGPFRYPAENMDALREMSLAWLEKKSEAIDDLIRICDTVRLQIVSHQPADEVKKAVSLCCETCLRTHEMKFLVYLVCEEKRLQSLQEEKDRIKKEEEKKAREEEERRRKKEYEDSRRSPIFFSARMD